MADITVFEEEPAQFKTQITGTPTPTVRWYREGALIPESEDFAVSFWCCCWAYNTTYASFN